MVFLRTNKLLWRFDFTNIEKTNITITITNYPGIPKKRHHQQSDQNFSVQTQWLEWSSGSLSCAWGIWMCSIDNIRALQMACFSGQNDRMPEKIFSLSASLVWILRHLCRAATWLADVLLSLILRLPPSEKQSFATAAHRQGKVGLGCVHWQDCLRPVCNLRDFKEEVYYYGYFYPTVVVSMLHHYLALPACCIIQKHNRYI